MKVTERLASLFIEENLRDREGLAEGANQFLESQLDDARRKLVEHETKLAEYKRQYNGELPSQTQSNLQVIGSSQSQVQGLSESINRDRDRRLMLERMLADASVEPAPDRSSRIAARGPRAPERRTPSPKPGLPPRSSKRAKAQLHALELRLKPEHPDIVRMKRAIRELEKKAEAEALQAPVSPSRPPSRRPRWTSAARTRSAIFTPKWTTSTSRLRTRRRRRRSWKRRLRPTSTASRRRRAVSWT